MTKVIIAMAIKDITLLLRDKMSMFFVLIFPIMFGLFTGVVFTGLTKSPPTMTLGVIDEDCSFYSQKFIQELHKIRGTQPRVTDFKEAEDSVRTGKFQGYIRIPAGFGQTAGTIAPNPPKVFIKSDPASYAGDERISAIVYEVMIALASERFSASPQRKMMSSHQLPHEQSPLNIPVQPDQQPAPAADRVIEPETLDENEPTFPTKNKSYRKVALIDIEVVHTADRVALDQWDALISGTSSPFEISFPLAMIWGIIGCVASFSASLVREKEHGTYLRLRSAPFRPGLILVGKALAMFVSVVAILALLILLGTLFGVRVTSIPKMAIVIVMLGYCFVGIMMLLSIFGKTEQAVSGAAWAILLVLAMFGGGMVPIEFLPEWMQQIGSATPVKWSIIAIEGALWRKFTYVELLWPLLLLFSWGTVCLIVGVRIFQRPNH